MVLQVSTHVTSRVDEDEDEEGEDAAAAAAGGAARSVEAVLGMPLVLGAPDHKNGVSPYWSQRKIVDHGGTHSDISCGFATCLASCVFACGKTTTDINVDAAVIHYLWEAPRCKLQLLNVRTMPAD